MTNKGNLNRGFIGLLMLLVVVAGIIFFIMRTDLFTRGKLGGENAKDEGVGLQGTNMLEQGQSAINKAKDAKALLEENDKRIFND